MRFFVLTKKKILGFGFCALLGAFALIIGFQGVGAVWETMASPRKSPVYWVQTEEKTVSLTFNTAWGNGQTQDILNVLDQYQVKASFFVTGRWAEQYPEMVTLISEKGHDICNYSNTHPRMTQLSREEQKEEILNCSETLRKITGFSPLVFRAPYGDCDPSVVETVNDLGMYCLQWNIDSLDWQNADPESMKNQVLSQLQPGSVILFHNGSDGTPQALPATIAAIQEAGYELKPVSQLLLPSPYLVDYEGKQIPKNT